MTLPFQSQFDSTPTKTDLTEIFSVAGIRTTEGVSDRPARPPRHVSPIEWDNVVRLGQYVLDCTLVR